MAVPFDPIQFIIMTIILFLGGAIQGSLGYGLGLFCVPFLTLLDPRLVPAPIMAATLVFNISVALREKIGLNFNGLLWIILGSIPGALLGAKILSIISLRTSSILIGAIVLVAVLLSILGLRMPPRKILFFLLGTVSATMAAIASIGGPTVAMAFQDEPGRRLRAVLASYFIVLSLLTVASLRLAGEFGMWELWHALYMLPGMMLGYLLSNRIIKRISQSQIRTGILILSTLSGIIVIIRQFL